ncbi:MAG: IS4 family transposase [Gammaproteobacteria bacterium]|nr:IS4 family transposase [Gammaproteobacteria bacterium]
MTASIYGTQSFRSHQHPPIAHHRHRLDALGFFNQLTSDLLFDEVESLLPAHRERLFPPTETLSLFLSQAISEDRSCQNAVNQAAMTRLVGGLPVCSTATGGYCRARQRLPLEMVRQLTRYTGQLIEGQVKDEWRWQGRPVKIVDGTSVSLPDTPANQYRYPQITNQKPGLGFPICQMVGVTCLSSGALLDAALCRIGGKGNDEQTLLRRLLESFKTNDLVLADAFYATYYLIAELQQRGIDAVFEQHGSRRRSTDFRRGKRLGSKDHLITLNRPKYPPAWMSRAQLEALPPTLTVRELRTDGKILVTTLCGPLTASKNALKRLYQSRWNIELDIRHIKSTMGMDVLSCQTPDMAEKETWIYLLAYNLIRLIMIQSALLCDIIPRQLSFKHTIQLWLIYHRQVIVSGIDVNLSNEFLILVGQKQVGHRPCRVEPRTLKRRRKPYSMLNKPRHILKHEIQQKWN